MNTNQCAHEIQAHIVALGRLRDEMEFNDPARVILDAAHKVLTTRWAAQYDREERARKRAAEHEAAVYQAVAEAA